MSELQKQTNPSKKLLVEKESSKNKTAQSKRAEDTIKSEAAEGENSQQPSVKVDEIGGPKGLEPTRYGDWESKGRCYDF